MADWKANSPFEWVGYYLGGPCHSDHSWRGKRAHLEATGWHVLPIFLGHQGGNLCGHDDLSPARGHQDGLDAVGAMKADGFPGGRYVFLDVERVDTFTTQQGQYVKAWFDAVLAEGTYLAAVYVHAHNVNEVRALLNASLVAHHHSATARLWICGGHAGFDITKVPADSGVADAFAWQGTLDVDKHFGSHTIHIDLNVSNTPTPGA
jgi:hypothetical protein